MKGRISLGLVSGSDGRRWRLALSDETASVLVLEAEIDLVAMSQMLGGMGHEPCVYEIGRMAHLAGATLEVRTECVPWTRTYGPDSEALADEALREYQVDGWIGAPGDLLNRHRRRADGSGYNVSFRRHVGPDGKPVDRRTRAELLAKLAEYEGASRG